MIHCNFWMTIFILKFKILTWAYDPGPLCRPFLEPPPPPHSPSPKNTFRFIPTAYYILPGPLKQLDPPLSGVDGWYNHWLCVRHWPTNLSHKLDCIEYRVPHLRHPMVTIDPPPPSSEEESESDRSHWLTFETLKSYWWRELVGQVA